MVASIHNNRKNPQIIRDVFRTSKTSKMEPFANIVDCIQPFKIFAKHSMSYYICVYQRKQQTNY